jgi:hypothetical protein
MAARGKAPFKPSINKLKKTSWPSHPVTMSAPNFCDIHDRVLKALREPSEQSAGLRTKEMTPATNSSESFK